jgi:hypothetical protein
MDPATDYYNIELIKIISLISFTNAHFKMAVFWDVAFVKICLTRGKSQLYIFTKRAIKQNVLIIEAYHCCQLYT